MPPSTYSIVACDLGRGEWGVAVQSKFLAVGALVSWAESGTGAIATQALMNPAYGPEGLELLRAGMNAAAAVEALTAADPGRAGRQLGIVDARGEAACFTGEGCMEWAGSRTGTGYALQGNLLVSGATLDAMEDGFRATAGSPLATRLLAALAAGQAAGGDRRGQQSAALLVARAGGGYGGADLAVDLRVDDHPEPVVELARLYELHTLYFGQTAPEQWLPLEGALAGEVAGLLAALGYAGGDLGVDLERWAGFANLEERVAGSARIDPVVLAELRAAGRG